ncbi:MAG: hypothetical protein ACR2QG_03665 [Gammaproteobacteria bacterium]
MAEQPVFWLGGKPGNKAKPSAPEAERYEPTLTEACEACGFEVDEFVAARGGYGGWLMHLERAGERYRLFWSGKSNQLNLEAAKPHGWVEVATAEQKDEALPGFVEAVKTMLAENGEPDV